LDSRALQSILLRRKRTTTTMRRRKRTTTTMRRRKRKWRENRGKCD
jgi:hypothetical protein